MKKIEDQPSKLALKRLQHFKKRYLRKLTLQRKRGTKRCVLVSKAEFPSEKLLKNKLFRYLLKLYIRRVIHKNREVFDRLAKS